MSTILYLPGIVTLTKLLMNTWSDVLHSALRACSLRFGEVPSGPVSLFSISAAQSAAPTVFVNAKRIEATGTSSSRVAATPKLYKKS